MRPLGILLLFITLSIFTSCEKDEENLQIKVEFIGSESYEIVNPEFEVQVYGYDPNYEDFPDTIITRQKFNSTVIPFIFKIEIPENAADKIEYISEKKDAQYYMYIEWDSDGNGQRCNGDLSIDYDAKFPRIFINKTEAQEISMKTLDSTSCE